MSLKVTLRNNELARMGRPAFISSTTKLIIVNYGEDRRHILHGATQISDVLIESFNRILTTYGTRRLERILNNSLDYFKAHGVNFRVGKGLAAKVAKVITIAFSSRRNLVVGSAVANQGIEKARESILTIRGKLNSYCLSLRTFKQAKAKTIELIEDSLKGSGMGTIALYRKNILELLQRAVMKTGEIVTLIRLLADFEFSCTLDIVHDGTTKAQNIWGLKAAGRLRQAIAERDDRTIRKILLRMV